MESLETSTIHQEMEAERRSGRSLNRAAAQLVAGTHDPTIDEHPGASVETQSPAPRTRCRPVRGGELRANMAALTGEVLSSGPGEQREGR
ncbi:hypothetical protein EYF80_054988 [Liparis tanakae]|uniref:Uncharacterized protein n=1 Tax=Liparis tanakae TaxID=230148 RepID=A0A4Z2F258_9TELE|nr:hypothetical protein EYF80_054988 [Liparis tanakae]